MTDPAALPPSIALLIHARARDLGGMPVGRVLPAPQRRFVGPFVFLDHMGPVDLEPGRGVDVPPHPHIGLATVTYLYDGEMVHRDSLGSVQTIRPHEVNWMSAGRGIVHSERTSPEVRQRGQRVHGLQAWVALPPEHEDGTPSFAHWDADALPVVERGGATVRVIAGAAFGLHSPVRVASPTVYVDVQLRADSDLPLDVDAPERAIYVASGELSCDGLSLPTGTLAVLHPGTAPTLRGEARIAVLGGAPLAGPHHIWWNFVASTTERIEAAKLAWHERRFATVPGDEIEFVPAPR